MKASVATTEGLSSQRSSSSLRSRINSQQLCCKVTKNRAYNQRLRYYFQRFQRLFTELPITLICGMRRCSDFVILCTKSNDNDNADAKRASVATKETLVSPRSVL